MRRLNANPFVVTEEKKHYKSTCCIMIINIIALNFLVHYRFIEQFVSENSTGQHCVYSNMLGLGYQEADLRMIVAKQSNIKAKNLNIHLPKRGTYTVADSSTVLQYYTRIKIKSATPIGLRDSHDVIKFKVHCKEYVQYGTIYEEPEHIQNHAAHCSVRFHGSNKRRNSGYFLSLVRSNGDLNGKSNQRGTRSRNVFFVVVVLLLYCVHKLPYAYILNSFICIKYFIIN